eukprot:TRINITY_DN13249_c0_g4_i1.p1 TRINITY_DN13249_c0_g4~~TRINITY_DN13249_c0_g4_i1.p1  ORF type:complete len:178 (-),score=11.89 TRINITY_DN13249_c0_g4_i1:109-642(-)
MSEQVCPQKAIKEQEVELHTEESGDSPLPEPESCLQKRKRGRYAVISQGDRRKLIDLVVGQRWDIKRASSECGINISTATAIVKTFLEKGRIGKKTTKDRIGKAVDAFHSKVMTTTPPTPKISLPSPQPFIPPVMASHKPFPPFSYMPSLSNYSMMAIQRQVNPILLYLPLFNPANV